MRKLFVVFILISIIVIGAETFVLRHLMKTDDQKGELAQEILTKYFALISQERYEDLYDYVEIVGDFSEEEFVARNRNIYQGIGAENIRIEIKEVTEEKNKIKIKFINRMDTKCGPLEFNNVATVFKNKDKQYKLEWTSNLILPELNDNYKVRVTSIEPKRGNILDRHGAQLATMRKVYNVGLVPGKMGENRDENIAKISELLLTSVESINEHLSSSWVTEESFVPIRYISTDNTELKEQLLQIPGVKIDSDYVRVYPYGEATSHITGYIQSISVEELEQLQDKEYSTNSVIGKTGIEKVFEERLKGKEGTKIYIENEQGGIVDTLAEIPVEDGENITLTIDIELQLQVYDLMKDDEGFFIVMNPVTGEMLAMVSTPSYDANKFISGMSSEEWDSLVNNPLDPLFTRFLENWCPGSTMKPLTGGIGLTSGRLKTTDVFYYSGLSWRKNSTWKENRITTLSSYKGKKNLRNALIYSDNIYFAQATLQIGEEAFRTGLDNLKFNADIGFELPTSKSQYSNTETIQGEVTLANSGYGQGEVLVNPIHMASIYSAFLNEGNMIRPYLEYKENAYPEYLVQNAFSPEAANEIKEGLVQVVENPYGTGHSVKISGLLLAGKTGTAELKETQKSTGDTLGWFDCFTADPDIENPMLIITMARNKPTSYLKEKVKTVLINSQ